MKSKVLFITTVSSHLRNFHMPYIKWFKENGYEVHVAFSDSADFKYVDKEWILPFNRNPFSLNNLRAYNQLKKILKKENYALISCHTPVSSVISRLASRRARRYGTKVIYMAHGFHFYRNAPILSWITFYPIELLLTKYTDGLITINNEDYNRIKEKGYKSTDYYKVPGVGVNKKNFYPINKSEKEELRVAKEFPVNKKILVYAAEFIDRKNHNFIIDAVASSPNRFKDILILFAGMGELEGKLKSKIDRLGLENIIQLIGFRRDIDEIFKLSDGGISSSRQEGLPVNLVEGMMCGLPFIATDIRGHNDVITNYQNGYLFPEHDYVKFVECVLDFTTNDKVEALSDNAIISVEQFELSHSFKEMTEIYLKYLN